MTRILSNTASESSSPAYGEEMVIDETNAAPGSETIVRSDDAQPTSRRGVRTQSAANDPAHQYYLGLSRQLATLTGMGGTDSMVAVGVTSSARHEGVTSVAVNLAAAAARDISGRVLLVDANLENPKAAHVAGSSGNSEGLADLLSSGNHRLNQCVQTSSLDHLHVLSTGTSSARADLAAGADRVRALLREMAGQYQMVIFDLPPASELTACLPLASCLDGVVMVVEAERTRNKAVNRAKQQLIQAGADVLGVVFNKRREYVPRWIYNRI